MAAPASDNAQIEHIGTLADGRSLVRVCCEVLPPEGASAPEWIQITPRGPLVQARDGRTFQINDNLRLLANTELPLLLDWEHESERPNGSTRAAGWIEELRWEDPASQPDGSAFPRAGMWGRVSWTSTGSSDVASRAYRYLSPVLLLDAETRSVEQIVSVALTNTPALRMHGLDSFREQLSARLGPWAHDGDTRMIHESIVALCATLGVAQDAQDATILETAASLKEACTKLTTELASATERAQAAEAKVTELETASFKADIETVLEKAAREGKVTPAAAKSWREFCSASRSNFDMFTSTVLPALPVIGEKAPASKPAEEPFDARSVDVESLRRAGLSDERIKAALDHNKSARAARQLGEDDSE